MSGGLILFLSDAGLRLCVLFLGEAVVCCVDGLDCGGGDQAQHLQPSPSLGISPTDAEKSPRVLRGARQPIIEI